MQIKIEKRKCWKKKPEHRWRKSDQDIHEEKLCIHDLEFKKDIAAKYNNNARASFAPADRQIKPPVSVASELQSIWICNEFDSYFTNKISKTD